MLLRHGWPREERLLSYFHSSLLQYNSYGHFPSSWLSNRSRAHNASFSNIIHCAGSQLLNTLSKPTLPFTSLNSLSSSTTKIVMSNLSSSALYAPSFIPHPTRSSLPVPSFPPPNCPSCKSRPMKLSTSIIFSRTPL